ncbi:MAG: cytochrome c3 family protein [Deltaproteobacteria bacterium]|nr:cytochrome c3 family protein [Deltaproteobacteria bacterium]
MDSAISSGGDWIRHPSDKVLPSSGEYASYTTYSVEAPVGRTTVPDAMGNTVTPGTDVVTCLSCHVAHASDYPDLLRWDYSTMNAGGGENTSGCFVCHTEKDTSGS